MNNVDLLNVLWNVFKNIDDSAKIQIVKAFDALYDVNGANYETLCMLSYALCAPYGNSLVDKAENGELCESDTRLIERYIEKTTNG